METTFLAIGLITLVALVIYFDTKNKDKDNTEINTLTSTVEITNIKMPFGSMVVFMVKWAIASIPALIILYLLFIMFGSVVTGIFSGMGHM